MHRRKIIYAIVAPRFKVWQGNKIVDATPDNRESYWRPAKTLSKAKRIFANCPEGTVIFGSIRSRKGLTNTLNKDFRYIPGVTQYCFRNGVI